MVLGVERWRCELLGYKKQKRRRRKSCLWTGLIHRGEDSTKSWYKKKKNVQKNLACGLGLTKLGILKKKYSDSFFLLLYNNKYQRPKKTQHQKTVENGQIATYHMASSPMAFMAIRPCFLVDTEIDYHSFGVQFLLPDWVMSPAIFFSEASFFERLASPKKLYLEESHPPPHEHVTLPPEALPLLSIATSAMDLNRGTAPPHESFAGARGRGLFFPLSLPLF